jgi:hypothetical protein
LTSLWPARENESTERLSITPGYRLSYSYSFRRFFNLRLPAVSFLTIIFILVLSAEPSCQARIEKDVSPVRNRISNGVNIDSLWVSVFKAGEKFIYKVKYNGISVGSIEWEYLGRAIIDGQEVVVLELIPDVKIARLLSLNTREKLYLNAQTYLPVRVKRQVSFLGKREDILEEYNQRENFVKITKLVAKGRKVEETIHREGPIHNAIALLYFFPRDVRLETEKSFSFNLPTRKVYINVVGHKDLRTQNGIFQTYLLEGHPPKFKIWLEKETGFPLRIEFPLLLGKIEILKSD